MSKEAIAEALKVLESLDALKAEERSLQEKTDEMRHRVAANQSMIELSDKKLAEAEAVLKQARSDASASTVKAKAKAEGLLAEAHDKAAAIVADAEEKAKKLVQNAVEKSAKDRAAVVKARQDLDVLIKQAEEAQSRHDSLVAAIADLKKQIAQA